MELELQATEKGMESLTMRDLIQLAENLRSMDGIKKVKPAGLGRLALDMEPDVSVSTIMQFVQTKHKDLFEVVEEA